MRNCKVIMMKVRAMVLLCQQEPNLPPICSSFLDIFLAEGLDILVPKRRRRVQSIVGDYPWKESHALLTLGTLVVGVVGGAFETGRPLDVDMGYKRDTEKGCEGFVTPFHLTGLGCTRWRVWSSVRHISMMAAAARSTGIGQAAEVRC